MTDIERRHFDIEKLVRAILSELREPTPKMIRAGAETEDPWEYMEQQRVAPDIWKAMIDSITGEDDGKE
jgi:hypothetical protein